MLYAVIGIAAFVIGFLAGMFSFAGMIASLLQTNDPVRTPKGGLEWKPRNVESDLIKDSIAEFQKTHGN